MRTIIGVIMLSLSSITVAGTYSDAAAKQETCDNQGDLAVKVYETYKSTDDPFDFSLATLKEHNRILQEAMNTNDDAQRIRLTLKASVLDAGINSKSKKSAYMRAWAECMDTLDKL